MPVIYFFLRWFNLGYHYVRETYVLFVLLSYPFFKNFNLDRIKNIIPVILFSWYLSLFLLNTKYFGILFWGITHIIGINILNESYNLSESLYVSFFGCIGFSWLYEIFWIPNFMDMIYNNKFSLNIHSSFLSLIIFIVIIYNKGIKDYREVFRGLIVFILFTVFYGFLIKIDFGHWFYINTGLRFIKYTSRFGGFFFLIKIFKSI